MTATSVKTSTSSSSSNSNQGVVTSNGAGTKKRLSLFSFGSSSSTDSKDIQPKDSTPHLSTSPTDKSDSTNTVVSSSFDNFPTLDEEHELHPDLIDNPECSIFERSVQDSCCVFEPQALNRQHSNSIISTNSIRSKRSQQQGPVRSYNSSISLNHFKSEDFIPPALDATTSLLSDKNTDLDDVELIYTNRRNSSVIGLNMALGRPLSPSRKNSVYSLNQSNQLPNLQTDFTSGSNQTSPSQIQSPISPPKLTPSKSSVNFYSYADMLNNDEFARRPSIKTSLSQGVVPTTNFTRNSSFIKHRNPSTSSQLSSQLHKEKKHMVHNRSPSIKPASSNSMNNTNSITTSLNKFLISPESSDEENEYTKDKLSNAVVNQPPKISNKRKSISSTTSSNHSFNPAFNDNESLISTSIGDCIRQSTTEINGH
ncbi:beta-1,6-N-acetylglucosaminyltransferase [Scheffersomyces coipomensis]|uniref:beta-1,6-N-acetylglucosaminyltransferase n=1 Tax=Scheffersomyces coipomensis TaxID=1788519 RepID=UPI00315C9F72